MKILKHLTILMFALLIFGCVSGPETSSGPSKSTKRPVWMDDLGSSYPEDQYLAVIGEGDSLQKAKANAASDVSLIFQNKISVDNTMESRFEELMSSGVLQSVSESTTMTENINQQSNQELTNMKYGESWVDDMGKTYVVGFIDRMETGQIYKVRIEDQAKVVAHLIGRANNQETLLGTYAFLDAAFAVAMANEVQIAQLDIINAGIKRTIHLGYNLGNLKADRADMAMDMNFQVRVNGDIDGRIEPLISGVLTEMGFGISDGGSLQIRGDFSMDKVDRGNDFVNYKWYLSLNLVDDRGIPVVSFEADTISAGMSDSAAVSRAYKDVEKEIQRQFSHQLNGYFDSFIEK